MTAPLRFLHDVPRFVFFTGKGGVGKTSLACATAVHLAEQGKRVLLVSTDPASNVGQVFEQPLSNHPTPITTVPGLHALEIDPHAAADAYRERIVGPVRGLLPEAEIAEITEQLSGSCTTEVASFNEFTELLADDATTSTFDHVLFDTAPTGHTLRLLKLPGEWTSYLNAGTGDASCLGPMAGLDKHRDDYATAMARLTDPTSTRLVLVTRAHRPALAEIARTATELAAVGVHSQHMVVNGVLNPAGVPLDDPLAAAVHRRERDALTHLPPPLPSLPQDVLALLPRQMMGVEALRSLLSGSTPPLTSSSLASAPLDAPALATLVEHLAVHDHGLIMCMGKGGVGKTTVASALALALAERGTDVLLTTTDPAAHLDAELAHGTLTVSRIDPEACVERYRARILKAKSPHLDDAGRAQLEEDLRSPCTEEIAVFEEFSQAVSQARRRVVVMDTAPTGHTLLLMDATGAYHRDVARKMGERDGYTTPLMRLQDPEHTRIVIVTLPETTPVLEASQLQDDLRRARIEPWAWVVNQSLAAAHTTDPLLQARAEGEHDPFEQVRRHAAAHGRLAVIPLLGEEPTGVDALLALTREDSAAKGAACANA